MKTISNRAVSMNQIDKEDAGVCCAPDKPYTRIQIWGLKLLGLMLARQLV
jgi:hypothetical protein